MKNYNYKTDSVGIGCLAAILIILLVLVLVGLKVWLLMALWNWLIPAFFGGPVVTYWQTLGMMVLLSSIGAMLFKRNS